MYTLARDALLIPDPASGGGSLVTEDGTVWQLNATAVVALDALREFGTVADAEAALHTRWPGVPEDNLRVDLDVLLGSLYRQGAVVQK